jgi:DNA-binding transcriptional MerR regulator
MPTLQRYKKLYQSRIPSVGKGRKQRYPREALEVFEEIKKENIGKRGRPKGSGGKRKATRSGRGRGRKPAAAAQSEGLLTLKEISERTGISYPTLSRYVKLYPDQLKFEGRGRKRRYHPDSVAVFQELRRSSKRGPSPKKGRGGRRPGRPRAVAATGGDNAALEARVKELEKQVKALERRLSKSIRIVIPPR